MPKEDPDGDLVKQWEKNTGSELSPANWTVLRLDGHCFHTFTKPFLRPHDPELSQAMIETTKDLCREFQAITGYTQSDEITLLIPPTPLDPETKEQRPLIFKGRRQKLESLTAGFASARFNYHLRSLAIIPGFSARTQNMLSGTAYFDSRVLSVPRLEDVALIFRWRYEQDCFRNGISSLAHAKFSAKELHHKSTRQQMCMLHGLGIDIFKDFPASLFFGTFVKKQMVEKMCVNFKTKAPEVSLRSEWHAFSVPSRPFPEKFLELLQSTHFSKNDGECWKFAQNS